MYKEIDLEEISFNKNNWLLLVTATDLETKYLHESFEHFNDSIGKIPLGNYTYFIAKFSEYYVVHVQCGKMGSISPTSAINTISDAIKLFEPKITLMIGIAFGVDNNEQNIGDVLVSECITPYNSKKVQGGKETIRSNDAPASRLLIERFKSALSWEYILNDELKAKKIISPILSGEELINDVNRRDELLAFKPTAKGGEMEGVGLCSAAEGKSEWILVKGICDFADGNKDLDKDNNQIIAIKSAISLCKEVFSSRKGFCSIGLNPVKRHQKQKEIINPQKINQILFDRYDKDKEQYYYSRKIDENIFSNLKFYSLWVYGKSGRGKSNIILRNIINNDLNHIIISLSNCIGLSIDEFFKEIFIELSEKLEPEIKTLGNVYFQQSIKDIIALLERHYKDTEIYIIIDEIPLGNDENCKKCTDKICSLFIANSLNSNSLNIKYVLSSIYSPLNHITEFNQKIYETVKFIEIEDWLPSDGLELINLIQNKLDLDVLEEIKDEIIIASDGSPRFIKKVFKNSFSLGGLNVNNYKNIVSETSRELNRN